MTAEVRSWADLYDDVRRRLGSATEARWIIEEASGERFGADVGMPPEKVLRRLADMVDRRLAGEPLQYVLGRWGFRDLDLMVDPRVLIPRPETEQIVEATLVELDRLRPERPGPLTVVDLGTGSGAVALSLAAERTGVEVWATDCSADSLAVARANLSGLAGRAATRVRLAEGDWWDALPAGLRGEVDLVVSNPPYVSSAEMAHLDPVVGDWEPRAALEAGPDGTEALQYLILSAPGWLRPGGTLVLEMAPHHGGRLTDTALRAGFPEVFLVEDLAGRDRGLVARGAP